MGGPAHTFGAPRGPKAGVFWGIGTFNMDQSVTVRGKPASLDPAKFRDPDVTLDGSRRAVVPFAGFRTLWFNTGTLCNLACFNCYIESSPRNDRLSYLTAAEVAPFLDELQRDWSAEEIGFTGGEPFMNPEIIAMLADALSRGFRVLVLTNAMRPMLKLKAPLLALRERHGDRLTLRVSVDHYTKELHELERGPLAWDRMIEGLDWLGRNGFHLNVAGRTHWREPEASLRRGFGRLFAKHGIDIDPDDPRELVLFPEMDVTQDVAEISEACWGLLNVDPGTMMCANSRLVQKRKGDAAPAVVACTLLPYDKGFEVGATLAEAAGPIKLNHPHCARFCVFGGGACGAT